MGEGSAIAPNPLLLVSFPLRTQLDFQNMSESTPQQIVDLLSSQMVDNLLIVSLGIIIVWITVVRNTNVLRREVASLKSLLQEANAAKGPFRSAKPAPIEAGEGGTKASGGSRVYIFLACIIIIALIFIFAH